MGIGDQAREISGMVDHRAVTGMRFVIRIEVAASAHAISTRAIACLGYAKTMLRIRLQTANFSLEAEHSGGLHQTHAARRGVALGALEFYRRMRRLVPDTQAANSKGTESKDTESRCRFRRKFVFMKV